MGFAREQTTELEMCTRPSTTPCQTYTRTRSAFRMDEKEEGDEFPPVFVPPGGSECAISPHPSSRQLNRILKHGLVANFSLPSVPDPTLRVCRPALATFSNPSLNPGSKLSHKARFVGTFYLRRIKERIVSAQYLFRF